MAVANRKGMLIAAAVAFVALAVIAGWLWGHKRTLDLVSSARGSITSATQRLTDAIALKPEATDALATVEEHRKAVGQSLELLRREDAKRNKELAQAAELYLVDAHAMLRNQSNAVRTHVAAIGSRRSLAAHMGRSDGRGSGWIQQALLLKEKAEKDNFEYRSALGAWAELLKTHPDTQEKVRGAWPQAPLLDKAVVDAAYKGVKSAELEAGAELERIRQMAIPR
jgi:hypothetical protein